MGFTFTPTSTFWISTDRLPSPPQEGNWKTITVSRREQQLSDQMTRNCSSLEQLAVISSSLHEPQRAMSQLIAHERAVADEHWKEYMMWAKIHVSRLVQLRASERQISKDTLQILQYDVDIANLRARSSLWKYKTGHRFADLLENDLASTLLDCAFPATPQMEE